MTLKSKPLTDMPVKTTCPYCGVGCGVLASPAGDGSVLIAGDPDHPANFGRLCSKGVNLGETLALGDRLLEPSVRGQNVTWDQALTIVADKFSEIINAHGGDAIALYVSGQFLTEDYYAANKFMKGCVGSANIDTNSRLCMSSTVAGHKRAFGTDTVPNVYEDIEAADVVVLVGSNLVWCHPILYQRLESAKEARPDLKIVCIDPRETVTARASDLHLALKPGSDVALFNGLLAALKARGQFDEAYIEAHVEGMDQALESAQAFTLNEISEITGLARRDIEAFYDLFAGTDKVMTLFSQGVNQSSAGTDKVNAILNCHLATARIGLPGAGPLSLTGQPNAMGGREVGGLANMLACHMNLEDEQHRDLVGRFWQSDVIPAGPGLKAVDLFQAIERGDVKAVWIMATNPVDSMPEADLVKAALEKCEMVVVSDVLQKTDTTAVADVLLPSLAWGEKSGTVTNSERRISRQAAFLAAPGNAKADWWQICEVAKRMGFDKLMSFGSARDIFVEHAALSAFENEGGRDFDIGALAHLSEGAYDALLPVLWPCFDEDNDRKAVKNDKKRFFAEGGFFTSNGKARAVATAYRAPLALLSDEFPLLLNTGRLRDQWHTMTRTAKSPRLMRHNGEPFVEIHPLDAARFDIKDASIAVLESEKGAALLRARITEGVLPQTLFAPLHWTDQYTSKARVDALVHANVDPVSGQPESKCTPTKISAFDCQAYGYVLSRSRPDVERLRVLFEEGAFYWTLIPIEGGWVLECAGDVLDEANAEVVSALLGFDVGLLTTDYEVLDPAMRTMRRAYFDGDLLSAFVAVSPKPVVLSRAFLMEQLKATFESPSDKFHLLYGRPLPDVPDIGAIVCSCFTVGALEIKDVIENKRCRSVKDVGRCLKAGTNCGSCRLEIQKLLDVNLVSELAD